MSRTNFTIALVASVALVQGAIQTDNDLWDKTHTSEGIDFINGIPVGKDAKTERRIKHAYALEENEMSDYLTKENVERVKTHLTADQFDELFPHRNAFYTYDSFLKAVAKYPAFCNENNEDDLGPSWGNHQTLSEVCRRELSALFAHISYQSGANDAHLGNVFMQGLMYLEDEDCSGNKPGCEYKVDSTKYPANANSFYYGRGPLMLTGNAEYGAFGDSFGPIKLDGKDRFLDKPEDVLTDDYTAWASALYFFMTPSNYKPSMHDVMTNHWIPNGTDTGMNINSGFGATIAIIGGADECKSYETVGSTARWTNYTQFLGYFGLYAGEPHVTCANNWSPDFPYGGAHNAIPQYYVKGAWNEPGTCNLKQWQGTPLFNVYTKDDYKRCVCHHWGTDADCAAEESGPPPAEVCAGQFEEAAKWDSQVSLDDFKGLPEGWGYTQNWNDENFKKAFNDHKGNDSSLDSAEWGILCVKLHNSGYKPVLTVDERCDEQYFNLDADGDAVLSFEEFEDIPSEWGYCPNWVQLNYMTAFNDHKGDNSHLESGEWLTLCQKLQDASYKPEPTPTQICDGQFDQAAKGDSSVSFNDFQDLPASFGYTQSWTTENFEVAFNDHKGNDENLDSGEWRTLCLKLQDANYKPTPPPPTPEEICTGQYQSADADGDGMVVLSEFKTLPAEWGYSQGWSHENFVAAFNDHKGNDENLDSAEWMTLCLELQNASYKPELPADERCTMQFPDAANGDSLITLDELKDIESSYSEWNYFQDWTVTHYKTAFDDHKGDDENLDSTEWQTLCLKLQVSSWKPDEPAPTPIDLDNEVSKMFEEIWKDMHYGDPDDELSRTLFQVDQSLDFIEKILGEFHDVMVAQNLYDGVILQD